jgi:hypothetical protein
MIYGIVLCEMKKENGTSFEFMTGLSLAAILSPTKATMPFFLSG